MKGKRSKTIERTGFIGIGLCLSVLALIVPAQFAQAGISNIWAVDDGEKVKKTDVNHPLATSSDNPVREGKPHWAYDMPYIILTTSLDRSTALRLSIHLTGVTNRDKRGCVPKEGVK